MGSNDPFPILSSMNINEERKSIEIIMENVPEKTDFWVRTPQDVLYAEGEKFTVLVDGVDTGYDLMKFPNDYVVGFIISENTTNVEIIGTRVIPEFGGLTILVLAISVMGIIHLARKNPILNGWTGIK
jgi:predicted secreted protein with PEFG-CTERM motif